MSIDVIRLSSNQCDRGYSIYIAVSYFSLEREDFELFPFPRALVRKRNIIDQTGIWTRFISFIAREDTKLATRFVIVLCLRSRRYSDLVWKDTRGSLLFGSLLNRTKQKPSLFYFVCPLARRKGEKELGGNVKRSRRTCFYTRRCWKISVRPTSQYLTESPNNIIFLLFFSSEELLDLFQYFFVYDCDRLSQETHQKLNL